MATIVIYIEYYTKLIFHSVKITIFMSTLGFFSILLVVCDAFRQDLFREMYLDEAKVSPSKIELMKEHTKM